MRTCIDCKRWRVEVAEPGFSEMTPGSEFSMSCIRGYWVLDPWEDSEEILREHLKMAETCKDFLQR